VFEGLDACSEGFMLHSELPIALRRVLGHEPTERQRKAFSAYFAGAPVRSLRCSLCEAPTLPVGSFLTRTPPRSLGLSMPSADRSAVACTKRAPVSCDSSFAHSFAPPPPSPYLSPLSGRATRAAGLAGRFRRCG